MFKQQKITDTQNFFEKISQREGRGVYFYRINGFNSTIADFIEKYYEAARLRGVVIEGRIPNPTEQNLSYYSETMGMAFQMSEAFLNSSLKKWLPRMNDLQRENVAAAMQDFFASMKAAGKTEGMLKNAYIKFMCWLYYKFERIVNLLGEEQIPKILYEGDISYYELMLMSILCHAGCDIVLLQYHGDAQYKKTDPQDQYSAALTLPGMQAFPEDYSLAGLRRAQRSRMEAERSRRTGAQIQSAAGSRPQAQRINTVRPQAQHSIAAGSRPQAQRINVVRPQVQSAANVWIEGDILQDMRREAQERGTDPKFYYNVYCQINGAWDKLTYVNDLYQFYQALKGKGRRIVVTDGALMPPTPEEIQRVTRKNYRSTEEMLMGLSANLQYPANQELQRILVTAFLDVMQEEAKMPGENQNKLTNKAVYLICWLRRYMPGLFQSWRMPQIACFIRMGGCQNRSEVLFMKMLAKLPVDVLILESHITISLDAENVGCA